MDDTVLYPISLLSIVYHYIDGDEHLIIRVYDHGTCAAAETALTTVLLSLHPALRYMIADHPVISATYTASLCWLKWCIQAVEVEPEDRYPFGGMRKLRDQARVRLTSDFRCASSQKTTASMVETGSRSHRSVPKTTSLYVHGAAICIRA